MYLHKVNVNLLSDLPTSVLLAYSQVPWGVDGVAFEEYLVKKIVLVLCSVFKNNFLLYRWSRDFMNGQVGFTSCQLCYCWKLSVILFWT